MKKSKTKKAKLKKNPLLIRVNPPSEVDRLWNKAKSMQPTLTRKEFDAAIVQFQNQHATLPKRLTMEDIPIAPHIKVMVKVGDVDQINYIPDKYSRKSPYRYYHATKKESLLTDAKGEVFVMSGKTRVSNAGRTKGWLID